MDENLEEILDEEVIDDIEVNNKPLSTWGAQSHLDYSIGETPISTDVFQPLNQNTCFLLKNTIGMRTLKITITFTGETLYAAKLARSGFNLECFNGCEIYIPDDGFYYSAILKNCGAEELVGIGSTTAQIKSTYTFSAFRHTALVTQGPYSGTGGMTVRFTCGSTIPLTCARITAKMAGTGQLLIGGVHVGVKLKNLPSGTNSILVDGMNKQIKVNNQNWMSNVDFTQWPTVVNGQNEILFTPNGSQVVSDAYIEYYPTFL